MFKIRCVAEIKKNGKWQLITNKIFRDWASKRKTYYAFTEVNYPAYTILDGMCKGFNFDRKECKRFIWPISKSRGYPDDMDESLKEDLKYQNIEPDEGDRPHLSNGLAPSWLTLEEIKHFYNSNGWRCKYREHGLVSYEVYKIYVSKDKYPMYRYNLYWSPDVEIISTRAANVIIRTRKPLPKGKRIYVDCEFPRITYKRTVNTFKLKTVPTLERYRKKNKVEDKDIRIIFDYEEW